MLITSKGGGRPGQMPEGTWRARIERIDEYRPGNLVIAFVGSDGSEAAGSEAADFVDLDRAEWRLRLLYEAATGAKYPAQGETWDTSELIGREVMLEVEHETYEGKERVRIRKIFPTG